MKLNTIVIYILKRVSIELAKEETNNILEKVIFYFVIMGATTVSRCNINDVHIHNILVSNKYHFGKKKFKCYVDYVNLPNDNIKLLLIQLPTLT